MIIRLTKYVIIILGQGNLRAILGYLNKVIWTPKEKLQEAAGFDATTIKVSLLKI